jgi:hypothetical protein
MSKTKYLGIKTLKELATDYTIDCEVITSLVKHGLIRVV